MHLLPYTRSENKERKKASKQCQQMAPNDGDYNDETCNDGKGRGNLFLFPFCVFLHMIMSCFLFILQIKCKICKL